GANIERVRPQHDILTRQVRLSSVSRAGRRTVDEPRTRSKKLRSRVTTSPQKDMQHFVPDSRTVFRDLRRKEYAIDESVRIARHHLPTPRETRAGYAIPVHVSEVARASRARL